MLLISEITHFPHFKLKTLTDTLFRYTTGACSGPCLHYDIDIDTRVDTPGTNCIYNHDYDVGFNLLVCSGSDLTGDCYNLQELPKTDITGNFNWHTPGTNSILRTAT